jgi:hypothetical protein
MAIASKITYDERHMQVSKMLDSHRPIPLLQIEMTKTKPSKSLSLSDSQASGQAGGAYPAVFVLEAVGCSGRSC